MQKSDSDRFLESLCLYGDSVRNWWIRDLSATSNEQYDDSEVRKGASTLQDAMTALEMELHLLPAARLFDYARKHHILPLDTVDRLTVQTGKRQNIRGCGRHELLQW